MDLQRGRSPSQGANIRHSPSPSPSPHPPFSQTLSAHSSLTPPLDPSFTTNNPAASPYDHLQQQQQQQQQQHYNPSLVNHTFLQAGAPDSSSFASQSSFFSTGAAATSNNNNSNHNINTTTTSLDSTSAGTIDPSFLDAPGTSDTSFLDPSLLDASFADSSLLADMATAQAPSPTPPHLLQPEMHRAHSASPHHSPNLNQTAAFSSPHSRHASLDPSSAAFPQTHGMAQNNNEWTGMGGFRGHRRSPSDAYSDVSSSAHPSPYLGNTEDFDPNANPSPLLGAQQDPALYSEMNFTQFSLNEPGSRHISPAHSPHISPRLLPQQQHQQQALPPFTADNNFGLSAPMNQFGQGLGVYGGQEAFPQLHPQNGALDFGHADQMSPPEINIDFAPPSRQASFEPPKPGDAENALSPPERSRSRNRMRAKSDSSLVPSRSGTPANGGAGNDFDPNSLSPNAAANKSRSPSPSKTNRRSSTSSVPHRDYILDLADPSRPSSVHPTGSENNGSKRTQKHPATFQCTLCPKRFTRAYNLRSHLRTHTDERPFVCTVCGKAFARQHDRKRHEGLHSGEKKFVCRGVLKDNNHWGCGRRFARADALGRHFRSEAGRVCIRPLLEEEAQEKGWEAQQQQAMNNGNGMVQHMQPAMGMSMHPQGFEPFPSLGADGMAQSGMASHGGYALPAALLQQYPALAGIQWDSLPPGPPDEMEGDISARSSFDASSGGEYYEEDDGDFKVGLSQGAPQYGYMAT